MFYDEDPVESKKGHIAPIIESRSKSSAAVESRRRIEKNTRKIEKPPPFGEGFSLSVLLPVIHVYLRSSLMASASASSLVSW